MLDTVLAGGDAAGVDIFRAVATTCKGKRNEFGKNEESLVQDSKRQNQAFASLLL